MRTKSVLFVFGLTGTFCLILLCLSTLPVTSQEIDMMSGIPGNDEDEEVILGDSPVLSPVGGVTSIVTKTIETYIPFQEYTYHFAIELDGLPGGSYTWRLAHFTPGTIQDISFDWQGGSGCTLQPDNDIVCGSGISYLYIEYRYSSVLSPTSNLLAIGTGSRANGYVPDQTASLVYVAPLTFITSTISSTGTPVTPDSHNGTTLQWIMPNTADGAIRVTFFDPRIRVMYLPFITKK